ncbi:hypothetical protein PLICRDRAFT_44466 [Plicaturopsis crispa FD-325 SS-3]|nr:hypothetical protein PLICRDRAFT_44466 [Plicaturopsis crispa FD-325 SS-3]
MPPGSLSRPLLPAAFLKKMRADPMMAGYESRSFTQEGHDVRLKLFYSPSSKLADRCFVEAEIEMLTISELAGDVDDGSPAPPSRRVIYTELHCAASEGDPIWACELIKLGCRRDIKCEGTTPLLIALRCILRDHHYLYRDLDTQSLIIQRTANLTERHLFIARMLIEQHADVNVDDDGVTPLLIACLLARHGSYWDLVSLLLRHGADPSLLPESIPDCLTPIVEGPVFPSAAMKSRFAELVKAFSKRRTRPARQCPCFSGRTLADCHGSAKSTPYPPSYICFCGSGKTYRHCCDRVDSHMEERWSDKDQRMTVAYATKSWDAEDDPYSAIRLQAAVGVTEYGEQVVLTVDEQKRRMAARDDAELGIYKWAANDLCARGTLEPAYAFAAQSAILRMRPSGRRQRELSRHMYTLLQEAWNAAVDAYIGLGTDARPKEEIERSAKIGIFHGALYRRCEGPQCTKLEGRDIAKLKTCARCSIAPYCSKTCQAAAWRTHKPECGSDDQREQALPAQLTLNKYFEELTTGFHDGPQKVLDTLGPELFHRLLDGMFFNMPYRREEIRASVHYPPSLQGTTPSR